MNFKKHLKFILPLVFLCLFAVKTFWGPDYFDGHDAQAHIVRLWQYDKALKDGQYPPRWAGDLMAGYGYPVFIFTYPFPYILAESFHLLGANLAVSIKLTFVFAYLASSLAVYAFAQKYWRSRLSGFLSVLLWSWAPPIFEKIFIGAAMGSVTSLMFPPLTLLFIYQLTKKPKSKAILWLTLSLTLWLHSHVITLIMFSPLLIVFTLIQLYQSKKPVPVIRSLFISLGLSALLSLWYLLPAFLELKYTHFHDFVFNEYHNQFVSLKRLLYSKWGTDAPGWGNNPVSQQVGISQWLAVALAAVGFILSKLKTKLKLLPFLFTFFLSIFLMLSISQPVWQACKLLRPVGIPWRFLSLSVFTAAILAGFIPQFFKSKIIKTVVIVFLVILTLYANRNHLRINQTVAYGQAFFNNYTGVATGWNEHMPIWVKDQPRQFPASKVETISGRCQITDLQNQSNLTAFTADCSEDSVVQINTAYYPRWQLTSNNQDITSNIKPYLDQSNGMIRFPLEAGTHAIQAVFSNSLIYRP